MGRREYSVQRSEKYVLDSEQRREREHAAAKSALLQAIRSQRTVFGRQLRDPRALFQAIDRDGSGSVSPEELATGLQRLGLGLTASQSEALALALDTDGDGDIGWEELARFLGADVGSVEAPPVDASAAPPAGQPALRIHFDPHAGYLFQQIDSGEVRQKPKLGSDLRFASPTALLEMSTKEAREELFRRMDPNANRQLSMNEYVDGLAVLLPQFDHQPAVRRAFVAADRDQSGLVSRREFRLLLHYTAFFHKKAAEFHRIDSNGDGRIDFSEFCDSCAEVGVLTDAAEMRTAFDSLDIDGGGYVRFSEFATWCARADAVSQGWDHSIVNAKAEGLTGGALKQRPRKLAVGTPEDAQLQFRRRTREKRLRRDARTLQRLEASQDESWRMQARRSLCCHASHSYRDLRTRCADEPEWVARERAKAVRSLSASMHLPLHQAEDTYMRTVAFMSVEGGDPLESSLLSVAERHTLAEEMAADGESGEGAAGSGETSVETSDETSGEGLQHSLSAIGRLRQAAHRVGKQVRASHFPSPSHFPYKLKGPRAQLRGHCAPQATVFLPPPSKRETHRAHSAPQPGHQIQVRKIGVCLLRPICIASGFVCMCVSVCLCVCACVSVSWSVSLSLFLRVTHHSPGQVRVGWL